MSDPTAEGSAQGAYRVLARKYRPTRFADLIGQNALVRTLTNAMTSGRLAHAFILSGVRGVGKTTTARIIARALNCEAGDTRTDWPEPCGTCASCKAIAEDRHPDVIEMDAASRTGIDDIRELIEGLRYRPVQARKKVYIIDEVHMLSRQAFNGLLKSLEEPPDHAVFIFATTEIRKVPVTVLSRCQRFDLRRVAEGELADHFAKVCESEGLEAEAGALAMIARAADGSVRDGLSLLDQAMALSDGGITETLVGSMLGLADRARIFDLFDAAMGGKPAEALATFQELTDLGADPLIVLQDLLALDHFLTRAKLVDGVLEETALPEMERMRGGEMATRLGLPQLAQSWQILLKGLKETEQAPLPQQAAEMVLVRLCCAADLPAPEELLRALEASTSGKGVESPSGGPSGDRAGGPSATAHRPATAAGTVQQDGLSANDANLPAGAPRLSHRNALRTASRSDGDLALAAPETVTKRAPDPLEDAVPELQPDPPKRDAREPDAMPADFPALVELVRRHREGILANHLENDVELVRYQAGRLELCPLPGAPRDLAGRLGARLLDWTGKRWVVSLGGTPSGRTLAQEKRSAAAARAAEVMEDPLVQDVLKTFPGATLVKHEKIEDGEN
jgi:DNA polymerase-3 subunit gamma/tau